MPTILVYYKGNPVNQVVALEGIGGKSTNMEDIEAFLVKMGAVRANDKRLIVNQDKDEDELERQGKSIYSGDEETERRVITIAILISDHGRV